MQKERRGASPWTVRYPHCAGLDVGKKESYVAVAEDAAVENVRTFGTYTAAFKQLSSWLRRGRPSAGTVASRTCWMVNGFGR